MIYMDILCNCKVEDVFFVSRSLCIHMLLIAFLYKSLYFRGRNSAHHCVLACIHSLQVLAV